MSGQKPTRDGQTVIITGSNPICSACGTRVAKPGWIVPLPKRHNLCLACAGFDRLELLSLGDQTLTRRAIKDSTRRIVVFQWNARRGGHERRGVLVDADALGAAKAACLADADARRRRRERDAVRRAELDVAYVAAFAARIRATFPGAPDGIETRIAEHACRKYSRRVGRSAAAKALDDDMIRLAVVASVRHTHTSYDEKLAAGVERAVARKKVKRAIDAILESWSRAGGQTDNRDDSLRKSPE